MRFLGKYWKVLLALILAAASIPVFMKAQTNTQEHQSAVSSIKSEIAVLQASINSNLEYEDVQDKLEPEIEKLDASRQELYSHFPSELLEEDQIRYIEYLEEQFGNQIQFSFSSITPIQTLSDGNYIGGLTLTVNYQTTYQGFKDMIHFLATDSRVTSVRFCSLSYDTASDTAAGSVTITLYTASATPYEPPEAGDYESGKDTIFG